MKRRRTQAQRKRSQRGSAMVEFAVLMLAFVPMILLPLYFVDAMRYKLEAQEAVYMSVWDFAFADYTNSDASGLAGTIDAKNKELYRNFKAGDEAEREDGTPLGPWADARWNSDLDCSAVEKDFATDAFVGGFLSLPMNFHDEFTKGGLVTCQGAIEVANYYIPSSFVDENDTALASKPLFNQQKVDADGDGEEDGADGPGKDQGGAWLPYRTIQMGLLVDPWCVHETNNIDGVCEDGKYCERVQYVWADAPSVMIQYMAWAWIAWIMFAAEMILDINITTIGMSPDDPHKLKMSVKHPPTGKRHGHYLTPMEDGNDDEFKQSYEARKSFYMGCENFVQGSGGNCSFD